MWDIPPWDNNPTTNLIKRYLEGNTQSSTIDICLYNRSSSDLFQVHKSSEFWKSGYS